MARTVRDNLKRKAAQAVSGLANVILDLNEIHTLFKEHHPDDAEFIEKIMVGLNTVRDAVLSWVLKTWNLDEEGLQSYL